MRYISIILLAFVLMACRPAPQPVDVSKSVAVTNACQVPEPAATAEHWRAMEQRDVERMLHAWQGPKEPTAADVAALYGQMGNTKITTEYFGSCRFVDGTVQSFYVVHLDDPAQTPKDIWYVMTTDKDGHLVDMQ